VVESPGLARSLLVSPDRQHNHIRLLRCPNRFRDTFAVLLWIARDDFILLPGTADRDLAAFVIENMDGPGAFANPFQHSPAVFRRSAVPAQKLAVGVWTDHGKRLDFAQIQGRRSPGIL
jgi:hypothetical protein